MNLKFVIFIFLSALMISGCSTTGSASAKQYKSKETQPERIEQLERDVQELKSRISALEAMLSGDSKTNEVVIAGEGWKTLANWRKLKTGMSYESVKKILGSAHRVYGGDLATWYYKNGGQVNFTRGELDMWMEPQ